MVWVLVVILGVLQALDLISTYIAMEMGAKESNPFVNWCIGKMGVIGGLMFPKLISMAVICGSAWLYPHYKPLMVLIGVACVIYGFIVRKNFKLAEVF